MRDNRTQDVVGGLIYKNGRLLLAQRSCQELNGKWEFPGGKVEPTESHQEALQRELKEELKIDTDVTHRVASSKFEINGKRYELHCYRVDILSGEPVATEHHKIEWVPIDDIFLKDLAPADIPIAKEALKYDW